MAITPPEYPTGPVISGSERSASIVDDLPFRDRFLDQREDQPVDDFVNRLSGRQRPAQIGTGLLGTADRVRSPLPGSSMVAAAKP